jgi:hypothetical protein
VSTTILPYCEIDGIPTLKDSELAHLFDMGIITKDDIR